MTTADSFAVQGVTYGYLMSKLCAKIYFPIQPGLGLRSETLMWQGMRAVKFFFDSGARGSSGVGKGVTRFVCNIREIMT